MFNASKVDNFINGALRFKGQWYKWGGGHGGEMKRPGGVDCSGLVEQAGYKADMNLIGTADAQQAKGKKISMKQLKPGDLVFNGNPAYHVGIYLGKGQVLHAPRTGKKISVVSVAQFQNARRIFKGLNDEAQKQLKNLKAVFNKADADHNGRLEGAELKQAPGLRRFDRQGAIEWKTVQNEFTKANSY